jgi:hypothetical protein
LGSGLLPTSPLLITESRQEFDRIRDALDREIKPRGPIEAMYVAEIACLVWEILRLRRCKTGIINNAFRTALEPILTQLLRETREWGCEVREAAETLARKWFSHPDSKKKVAELLEVFGLDETTIEAEAVRQSAQDLERIDRLLASSEARRNKALVCVAQYRGDLGALLRETTDRMIDSKVLQLEHRADKVKKSVA